MANLSFEFDVSVQRRLRGRGFKVYVESVENDSYIASVVPHQTNHQDDDVGALYYVIAVIFIYGCSILMMIASYTRKNQSDRKLNRYLKEMAYVRKREILYATARTANKLEKFNAGQTVSNFPSALQTSNLRKQSSTNSMDRCVHTPDRRRAKHNVAFAGSYTPGRAVPQVINTVSVSSNPLTSSVNNQSGSTLTTPTARRLAFKTRHFSLDNWITESDEIEGDERWNSENDVKFSISPIDSVRHSPISASPSCDSLPTESSFKNKLSPKINSRLATNERRAPKSLALTIQDDKWKHYCTARDRTHKYSAIEQQETYVYMSRDTDDTECARDITKPESARMKYERLLRQNQAQDLVISAV